MNSKLPPKYTILFLLLFISISNKVETLPCDKAELYLANTATAGKAFVVSAPTSILADKHSVKNASVLESYQWYADMVSHICC